MIDRFYPPSPRAVSPARAAEIVCRGARPGCGGSGCSSTPTTPRSAAVLEAAPIDILQFHGGESPGADRRGEGALRPRRHEGDRRRRAGGRARRGPLRRRRRHALFDAKPPRRADALPGGNGLVFDWRLIAGRQWRRPWMLSGGLTSALLPEAVGFREREGSTCRPASNAGPATRTRKNPRIPRRSPHALITTETRRT